MEYIDQICREVKSAECLNALHACRDGHPLGTDNPWKFRNALAMVNQQDYFVRRDIPSQAHAWLEGMASSEMRIAQKCP